MREPVLGEQYADIGKQHHALRLGMWIFLASELMLFSGLLALYGAYRTMYPHEFAVGVAHNSILIGSVNMLVLGLSSLAASLALHSMRGGFERSASWLLSLTLFCGFVFLALKLTEWGMHWRDGIRPGELYSNADLIGHGYIIFFTLYYLLTGLHFIHMVGGMLFMTYVCVQSWRRAYSNASHTQLEMGGLYWHLVHIVWIILWPLLYLMRG